MKYGAKFWISMLVFQVVFGLSVFAVTRNYYAVAPELESPGQFSSVKPALLESIFTDVPIPNDPVEISRQANERFASRQYVQAAALYETLLALDPDNVDTLNNLGLTLHYVGRSDEARQRLNEGAALDPTYQRIWLTLGFVNSTLGNVADARAALNTAVDIDPDNDVGKSASRMLKELQ